MRRAGQSVLSDLKEVDVLICPGDVLGDYADVKEVCIRLREYDARVVRGNHDAYVLGILQPNPSRVDAYRTEWTKQILTPENHRWLASLPVELALRWLG